MKRMMTMLGLCAAVPLCAQTLAVNAPATTETLANDQTVAIAEGLTVGAGETAVFSARLTMTLPTEAVARDEALDGKFALTADSDGTVLAYTYVADESPAWQWRALSEGFTVAEGEVLDVEVAVSHERDAEGSRANYRVSAWKPGAEEAGRARVAYAAPMDAVAFGEVALEGEGEATGLAVAAVRQSILPPMAEGGAQSPELVAKYATWLNDAAKGGAMPAGASDAAISDAFAMNVGGTPKLTVERVSPAGEQGLTLTVRASYVDAAGQEHDADWQQINGRCYVLSAAELGGEVSMWVSDTVGGAFPELPRFEFDTAEGARFAKVVVGFDEPEKKL